MKFTLTILVIAILSITGFSQKAEKIYGGARQNKPASYYKEQAIAWKKEINKDPKNPNNWYNYYYVYRNLFYNDTTDKRSWEEKDAFFQTLSMDMEKNIPNTYEFNLCKWMIGGFNMKLLPYLKKAVELGEGRTEHLDFLINIGETERNIKDRDLYSLKKFEAGLCSAGITNYNYNVLMGLEKNAILITDGDNDTYPVWLLQAQGIRKDVTVLNLSFIGGIEEYRTKLFAELGVPKWERKEKSDAEMIEKEPDRYKKEIVKHIASNTKKYPVYVALTAACSEKYLESVKQNLYLTGLAYLYSNEAVDNIAFLKKNMEQNFALDYIDKTFYQDLSPQMVKMANGNYIVPMLTLYDHYKISGEQQKQEWIKSKVLAVVKDTDDEENVKEHLAK
jgi:hypothetical protein